jgi:hypothetical protein
LVVGKIMGRRETKTQAFEIARETYPLSGHSLRHRIVRAVPSNCQRGSSVFAFAKKVRQLGDVGGDPAHTLSINPRSDQCTTDGAFEITEDLSSGFAAHFRRGFSSCEASSIFYGGDGHKLVKLDINGARAKANFTVGQVIFPHTLEAFVEAQLRDHWLSLKKPGAPFAKRSGTLTSKRPLLRRPASSWRKRIERRSRNAVTRRLATSAPTDSSGTTRRSFFFNVLALDNLRLVSRTASQTEWRASVDRRFALNVSACQIVYTASSR